MSKFGRTYPQVCKGTEVRHLTGLPRAIRAWRQWFLVQILLAMLMVTGAAQAQISTPYPLIGCGTTSDVSVSLSGFTVTDICSSPTDTYTVQGNATFTMASSGTR